MSKRDTRALARHRPAHARPSLLRRVLWAGLPASGLMIAIAQSDPYRLRVLDYCGTVILLTCTIGLPLRWWFEHRARQPVDKRVAALEQQQAWDRQKMTRVERLLADLCGYAAGGDSGGDSGNIKRRHLRPVRNDDTGPRRAMLGGAPLLVAIKAPHVTREIKPA